MKATITWVESTTCRAEIEVADEEELQTLVKRLEVWGDVPKELEDAREETDYSIDDVEVEEE